MNVENLERRLCYSLLTIAATISNVNAASRPATTAPPQQRDTVRGVEMQEVVVSAPRGRTIGGMSADNVVVTPQALSGTPSFSGGVDLMKALALTPAVQNPGDASNSLYIRGGDAGQNLLLYEGATLYSSGRLFGFFPLFNADHIAALEMNVANCHPRYGGRLSGIVEARTRTDIPENPKHASMDANIGLLASQATLRTPLGRHFVAALSARKTYLNAIVKPFLEKTLVKDAETPDYDFSDVNFTLAGELFDNEYIKFDALISDDRLSLTDNELLLNGLMRWNNSLFTARWVHSEGTLRITNQAYMSRYNNRVGTTQAQTGLSLRSSLADYGFKSRCSVYLNDVALEAGWQYSFLDVMPQSYTISNASQTYGSASPAQTETAHDAAAYVSANIPLSLRCEVATGLRYAAFFHRSWFTGLEPDVAITYRLTDNTLLRASWRRQNQFLLFLSPASVGLPLDFWAPATKDVLPPQQADAFSAGFYKSLKDNAFELSADLFYRRMRNLNEFIQTVTSGEAQMFSGELFIGNGHAYGMELLLKKNSGRLTGWLSYTLARSERCFPDINDGAVFPARFDRRHNLSLIVGYALSSRWRCSLVYVLASGNAYTMPSSWYFSGNMPVKEYGAYNGSRMPLYRRTDAAVSYRLNARNELALSVYNLFNVNNPVYIFMNVQRDNEGTLVIKTRHKQLTTVMPSITWRIGI
jgi:outer membrane receptor protein involved in Fe transport